METRPKVLYVERFISDADCLFQTVLEQTVWDSSMHARQTASYGEPYNYSQMAYPKKSMPGWLQEVCTAIHNQVGFLPNNALLNKYADGGSTMGFHEDSIAELQVGTGVAIVSLGCQRSLTFRRTAHHDVRWVCPLAHGSLLYMPPEVQLEWQHGLRKQAGAALRVSLTFRALASIGP